VDVVTGQKQVGDFTPMEKGENHETESDQRTCNGSIDTADISRNTQRLSENIQGTWL
jgi:hypothetical protein